MQPVERLAGARGIDDIRDDAPADGLELLRARRRGRRVLWGPSAWLSGRLPSDFPSVTFAFCARRAAMLSRFAR
jgi:hypothetical protein